MTSKEFFNKLKDIIYRAEIRPNYGFIVEDTQDLLEQYKNSLNWPKKVKWGKEVAND